jgi:hypothetical protein
MKNEVIKIKNNVSLYLNFRVLFLSLASASIYLLSLSSALAVHSEEFQKNSVSKNINEVSNLGVRTDDFIKTKNKYCEEDKKDKRDSKLCGQSMQLDEQEELTYKKLTQPAKTKVDIQSQEQRPAATIPKTIIRKPVIRRISCAEKNDHPSNSDTKGRHMDEDCCPDPDEWPKPGCVYSPSGRALMMKGPK